MRSSELSLPSTLLLVAVPLLGNLDVDDLPAIGGMDQIVSVAPLPAVLLFVPPLAVHVVDYAAHRNPDHRCYQHYGADYVVTQEQQHLVDVDVLDYVPEPLHHVLDGFLAVALKVDTEVKTSYSSMARF